MGLFGSKEKKSLFAVSKRKNIFEIKDFNAKTPIINEKKVSLKLIGNDVVEFNGKKYQIELETKHQNYYEILINGKCYTYSVETPFSIERKKMLENKEGESAFDEIISPMPGKIIEIFAEEGSEVHEGDPLLILEAMKMQNEILSPCSGKVTGVKIKKDQNVMKDELMIVIEKA